MTWSSADSEASWPDPPGWDPTPCCGSHALLPVVWPLAWLRVRVQEPTWRKRGCGTSLLAWLLVVLVPLILWGLL